MKKKFEITKSKNLLLFTLGLFLSWQVQGQMTTDEQIAPASLYVQQPLFVPIGQYDVRLVEEQSIDCDNNVLYVDIELRASSLSTPYRLADQNYRFTYDLAVLSNPRLEQELDISGFIVGSDGNGSFYGAHTLTGTLGEVISYNVELAGGTGYLMDTTWLSIGRMAFDIIDPTGCINLDWIDESSFPPTYVGEIDNGNLFKADEGVYGSFSGCVDDLCAEDCPVLLGLPGAVPDGTYSAKISVYSDGIIMPGSNVSFKAGNDITLDVGFSVEPQADFSAEIEGCISGGN